MGRNQNQFHGQVLHRELRDDPDKCNIPLNMMPYRTDLFGLFFFFQMIVFRSVKSGMTDFLSPLKSKFNGRFPPLDGCFITATEVFTVTALTILLKYSYKYRRTLMGFMICCHQLHVS